MSNRHEGRKRSYESDRDRDRDSDFHHESKRSRTETPKAKGAKGAKVIWVLRGQKEVAAFSAINNPATHITGNRHKHICSNCSTEYEHDHPYRKSEHPQHIKDCPKCKSSAPEDRPVERRSTGYKSDFSSKYSNRNNHRRHSDPYPRRNNSFRRRSRSRSRSPPRKSRDYSPRRPSRR